MSRRSVAIVPLLAACILSAAACGLFGPDELEPREPMPDGSFDIIRPQFDTSLLAHGEIHALPDVRLLFNIDERLQYGTGERPRMGMHVRTEKTMGSSSVRFVADAGVDSSGMYVEFVGVFHPDCQSADVWYTTWNADLRLAEGSCTLRIAYRDRTDRYRVLADEEYLRVRPVRTEGATVPEFTDFYRCPRNSFAIYASGTTVDAATAFVHTVRARYGLSGFELPAQRDGLRTGYSREPNALAMNAPSFMRPGYFIYHDEAHYDEIRRMGRALADSMQPTDPVFTIHTINWLGKM